MVISSWTGGGRPVLHPLLVALALTLSHNGVYYVDDDNNTLNLLH